MRRSMWLGAALLGAAWSVAGCGSNEPEPQRERPPARRAEPAEAPSGVLAPVDAWRDALTTRLPAPWTLTEIAAQVEAPEGYTRVAGGRGLLIRIGGGPEEQRFWVMPRGFEGTSQSAEPAVVVQGERDDMLLFGRRPAWEHTPVVLEALGMRAVK